ncbi:MAG: O-antigen ligase family protein [Actinomycetota bacterium]|nr:O-antigen ligase family protein [Actinomycetota bacterium]
MQAERNSSLDKVIYWALWLFVFLLPPTQNPFGFDICQIPKLTLLRIFTLIILAIWLIRVVDEGQITVSRTPLDVPILFFLLAALVATLNSIHLPTAFFGEFYGARHEGLLTVANYVLLYYIVVNVVRERKHFTYLVMGLMASALVVSIYGVCQRFGLDPWLAIYSRSADVARSFSTFGNALFFGGYLALVLPLPLVLLFRHKHTLSTFIPLSLLSGIVLASLIFTYARSAWLGALGGIVLIALFSYKRIFKNKVVIAALLVIFLSSVLWLVLPSPYKSRYTVGGRVASLAEVTEGSGATRLQTWGMTLRMIRDRPILGSGPDTYGLISPWYRPATWKIYSGGDFENKAHNDFLQIAATMGLLGLLGYLWVLAVFFWRGFSIFKGTRDPYHKTLILGFLAGAFAYIIFLQFSFAEVSTTPFLWMFMGLIIALGRHQGMGGVTLLRKVRLGEGGRYAVYALVISLTLFLVVKAMAPFYADLHLRKGMECTRAKDWREAERAFKKTASLVGNEEYLMWLGDFYLRRAEWNPERNGKLFYLTLSTETFQRAKAVNPLDELAYICLGEVYLYGAGLDETYFDSAIGEFKEALKIDPNYYRIHRLLGVAYLGHGDLAEAVEHLEVAVNLYPKAAYSYVLLGDAYRESGLKDKAIKAYEKALELNPTAHGARKALEELLNTE